MPKQHGDRVSGRFVETIDPHKPIVWDDGFAYFNVPTTQPAPVIKIEDEHTRITRRLAASVKTGQERARQARMASLKTGPIFIIPEDK